VPRPRFDKLSPAKRRRILEAAALEFAAHGFDQASLNRIISAAGISKGAAYYYFDDKADLYATVVLEGWQALLPAAGLDLSRLDRASFWPVLREIYGQMLVEASGQPWLIAVGKLVYGPPPSPSVGALVAAEFARAMEWLGGLITRGQQVGAIRGDLPAPFLVSVLGAVLEAADRWSVQHADELGPAGIDRLAVVLFDMVERFVGPPGVEGGR
jgi:AcrR family transcriptional regulator